MNAYLGPLFSFARNLFPAPVRARLRGALGRLRRRTAGTPFEALDLALRRWEESNRFSQETDVGALPPIQAYWSNRHLVPLLREFGFSTHEELFAGAILRQASASGPRRVLSLGAGNCDTELRVAALLVDAGDRDWTFHCIDLVPEMLERGRIAAEHQGLKESFTFEVADFNSWTSDDRFDIVMANQCLHHVVALESLLDRVSGMLNEQGRFVLSDMIGRNGHQRWPEARAVVERFWEELPPNYRFHRQLKRWEKRFLDWDCSVGGFEGVRSQDILPLLCQRFHFETFVAYGNLIDPFIDRGFGGHFNAEAEWDRDFIDRVQAEDVAGILSGRWTPTHLMAVCSREPAAMSRCWPPQGPAACIRTPC